jgi:phage regulator Rha-like protein
MKRPGPSNSPISIESVIHTLRGEKVILDADLARIYGVTTKRLNEQVKRNAHRFPSDFVFQVTKVELDHLREQIPRSARSGNRSQFATGSQKHRDPRFLPFAFTEHGALMAANVLNSQQAVEMSVLVVRAFVRMRHVLATHKDLAQKLAALERRVGTHDKQMQVIFEAIRQLMTPPVTRRKPIGFIVKERAARYGRA